MNRRTAVLQDGGARFARVWSIVSASSLIATVGWSQTLTWLGTLPDGYISEAWGVSADGSVVVGYASNAAGLSRAFRWTQATGMQDLGTLGGVWSEAYGVSADGSVVVGWATDAAEEGRAFRWQNGVMQDLGTLGGVWSEAYGVSADGSVVVGMARNAAGQQRAFRMWTTTAASTMPTYLLCCLRLATRARTSPKTSLATEQWTTPTC